MPKEYLLYTIYLSPVAILAVLLILKYWKKPSLDDVDTELDKQLTGYEKVMESNSPKSQPKTVGCLVFIVVYLLCLTGMYFNTIPPEETKDFSGRVAERFFIAGVVKMNSQQNQEYMVFSLKALRSKNPILFNVTFLLPEKAITIKVGDVHRAKILEDHGEWQLVEFNYSNTHTSTSIYRAYNDRIEPVSYKLMSHVGQAIWAIILFIPALILSKVITAILNWHSSRSIRDKNA